MLRLRLFIRVLLPRFDLENNDHYVLGLKEWDLRKAHVM